MQHASPVVKNVCSCVHACVVCVCVCRNRGGVFREREGGARGGEGEERARARARVLASNMCTRGVHPPAAGLLKDERCTPAGRLIFCPNDALCLDMVTVYALKAAPFTVHPEVRIGRDPRVAPSSLAAASLAHPPRIPGS